MPATIKQYRDKCRLTYKGGTMQGTAEVVEVNMDAERQFINYVIPDPETSPGFPSVAGDNTAELFLSDGRRAIVHMTNFVGGAVYGTGHTDRPDR